MNEEKAIKKLEGLKYALASTELELGGCKKEIEAVKMGIEALEQTMWVPVSERLPEYYQDVLAYCEDGLMRIVYFDESDWIWRTQESRLVFHDPIAWVPIPKYMQKVWDKQ